jgi:hypothetical protein
MDRYATKGSDMFMVSIISLLTVTCVLAGEAKAQSLDRPQVKAFGYSIDAPNDRARVAADFQASAADRSSATPDSRTVGGAQQIKAFGYWVDAPHYQ